MCLDPATCSSAAPEASGAPEQPATYGIRPETRNTITRGGDEGNPFSLRCPAGQIAVGVTVRSEAAVDAVAITCAPLNPDGTLGDAHATRPAGGPGGTSATAQCAAGHAAVGLQGRSGVRVERLGVQCGRLERGSVGAPSAEGPPQHGGTGGDPFVDTCAAGYVLTGLDGRAADTIVSLRAQCTRIAPTNGPNYATVPATVRSLGSRGVVTIGNPYALRCPAGEVAVGLSGHHTSVVDQVALNCARLYSDGSIGEVRERGTAGGDAGEEFTIDCPVGRVLVGVSGRAGRALDRLGAQCAPVERWMSANAESETVGGHGGNGGDPFTDLCPAGNVVYGLSGRAGNLVDALQVECMRVQR